MEHARCAGVLLHPTSLPGSCGIGDLGPQAYRWIDWLSGAGCRLWQVLPLGPTGFGDSPYQCFSSFAGNPNLISLVMLAKDGLLQSPNLGQGCGFSSLRVDYGAVIPWKLAVLAQAFAHFAGMSEPASGALRGLRTAFDTFCSENASWLEDYVLFMAIKQAHGGRAWFSWPRRLRRRDPSVLKQARKHLARPMAFFAFCQFIFFRQWMALKAYANGKGIQIIGDIPIFVASDSVDVWANPGLFQLERDGRPAVVAGVPPDYFSPTGQRWGNPLYRWEAHQASGYSWWLDRLKAVLRSVDILRLDHFRGFAGCWEISSDAATAEKGRWVAGPGADFFATVQEKLGELPLIAEDLGQITPDVIALRDRFGLPGMKVLQFVFSAQESSHLLHCCDRNCVVYTGTHDNDTARGWYESASPEERQSAQRYLGMRQSGSGRRFAWELIRAAWASQADFALAPLQDLLGLGSEARMNYPGRVGDNWDWRMPKGALSGKLQRRLRHLNRRYWR